MINSGTPLKCKIDSKPIQRGEAPQEALQRFTNDSLSHDSPHPKLCS